VKFLRAVLCVLALTLCIAGITLAQEPSKEQGSQKDTGSITGTVRDSSGSVVPGAAITITNAVGLKQTTNSDEQGDYLIPGLPPGTYKVAVSAPGFKPFEANLIVLTAGQNARSDASLELAGATTSVHVEGEKTAQVETETPQISGTITEKEITAVGLNGRNFTQLITLAPGVSNQTGQDEALVGVKGSVKYSVNGGRVEYNTFDVDGGDVLNAGINGSQSTLIVFPSLDAISEVKVLTSNYGAMYGRSASGTILVTTKSGGSQFHGNAYEFNRNEIFNARNFFDETSRAPLYRRNDYGFTLGGPIYIPDHYNTKKDKTFFFFSEEVRQEKTPQEFNQAVPTLAERSGNFADVCPFAEPGQNGLPGQQVFFKRSQFPDCPQKSAADQAGNVLTFPGNQVPIDPNAAAILGTGIIPAPTSTVGCNSSIGSCYDAVVSPSTYWREELFRIDHSFTQNMRASFRYIHDTWDTTTPTPQWSYIQSSFPTIQNDFVGPGLSLVGRLTNVITNTLLNDFVASYTTDHISLTDTNGPGATFQRPAGLTVGYLFNNGFGGKVPAIVIGGNNAEYGGNGFAVDSSYPPWHHSNPTVAMRDDISKSVGKHTFQFGVQLVFAHKNEINNAAGANTGDLQGIITFSNQNSIFSTSNAFADFLTGGIKSFQQDSAQTKYYNSYTIGEPYFQDDWRVLPRLTLNLGLRMSLFGLWHEKYDQAHNWTPQAFNPAIAPGVDPFFGVLIDPTTGQPIPLNVNHLDPRITNGIVQCGVNGVPAGCMKGHLFNPAPRVGFAWDLKGDGKTSVRGGYGIFFHHGTGNEANTGSLEGSPPIVLDMTQNFPFGYACIGGVGQGCGGAGAYPLNVTAIPSQVVWPYVQQWSLSMQRELSPKWIATIAYVGSKGTHLTAARQINQLTPFDPTENPFGPGRPITTAICDTYDGSSFLIGNNTLTQGQPGFVNLEAACFGTVGRNFPNVNSLRTFAPGFGQIFSLENIANSSYNALQATLRRTVGPLALDLSYSYGHSIDDSSDRFDATFVNSANLESNRASSNFDQRHLLNFSYVYDFSFMRVADIPGWFNKNVIKPDAVTGFPKWFKKNVIRDNPASSDSTPATASAAKAPAAPAPSGSSWFNSSRFAHNVLDGWELTGITTFQSGTPFSVINGASGVTGISVLDNAGVANGTGAGSYPDITKNPAPLLPGANNAPNTFGPLLGNPGMFVAPQGLTFGDAGRNALNNPSRLNFDMALLKRFHFSESRSLELRAEAFNVFNHTQFRIYDADRGNTANNTISCYGGKDNSAGHVGGGVNCLAGDSFLRPIDAHRPRTMQFGLKFFF